jgi:hypothetical protein
MFYFKTDIKLYKRPKTIRVGNESCGGFIIDDVQLYKLTIISCLLANDASYDISMRYKYKANIIIINLLLLMQYST